MIKKYMKMKFRKTLEMHDVVIFFRFVFNNDKICCLQVVLDESLYK